ncbi:MAG: hypothetical protein WKF96_18820 [Solirubrobacteraceae bacterium]
MRFTLFEFAGGEPALLALAAPHHARCLADPELPADPAFRSALGRVCCILLAFCNMKTLYLRNVPDDVSERLASLAAREGLSVSSFALRELSHAARRAYNPALLSDLPDLDVSATDVVADLEGSRLPR